MILNDKQIRALCEGRGPESMIYPFESNQVRTRERLLTEAEKEAVMNGTWGDTSNILFRDSRPAYLVEKLISYGTSSFGYDVRVDNEFKIFTNVNSTVVDPKNFDPKSFVDFRGPVCTIPPNSFALAKTVEYFKIPRDVLTICVGKSTYARCGVIVNVTPFEPEWEGQVTLEFSNTTPLPARIYAGEGCAQILFLQGEECGTSYKDRGGKYQHQSGVVIPRI